VGKYLGLVRSLPRTRPNNVKPKVKPKDDRSSVEEANAAEATQRGATKATEATKPPTPDAPRNRDKSGRRGVTRILTLREVLAEINHQGSGPAKNAELYRRGELSEDKAVEYVTCAILRRRGESFEGWRAHAPTVRAALTHRVGCDCEVCG
jgi:hypothetical protein